MNYIPENDADSVMLEKDGMLEKDCMLSSLYPPLPEGYFDGKDLDRILTPEKNEKTWGISVGVENLNEIGADPMSRQDIKPKSAVKIGLWFKF